MDWVCGDRSRVLRDCHGALLRRVPGAGSREACPSSVSKVSGVGVAKVSQAVLKWRLVGGRCRDGGRSGRRPSGTGATQDRAEAQDWVAGEEGVVSGSGDGGRFARWSVLSRAW